jgi:hypothetical protein
MLLARRRGDIGDEMPIDLDVVDGVVAQQLELSAADAEIVDGDLEAGRRILAISGPNSAMAVLSKRSESSKQIDDGGMECICR